MKNVTNKFLAPLSAGLLLAMGLSGCAANQNVREINTNGQAHALDALERMRNPSVESRSFSVQENGFYAAKTPISVVPINPSLVLPPRFKESFGTNYQSSVALSEVAAKVTQVTGYEVKIDADVLAEGASGGAPRATAAALPPVALPASGPLPDPSAPPSTLPPLPAQAMVELSAAPSGTVLNDLVYKGTLGGFMDEVSARLGLSWRWNGKRIEVFRYETKMFHLNALAGETSSSSTLSISSTTSSGGGGGSGGGSSSGGGNEGSSGTEVSVSDNLQIWADVENNLKAVLSANGKITVSPSSATIMVKDSPNVLSQVEAQINEYNRIYSKQVIFHMEIYSIERSRNQDFSVDLNAVFAKAGRWGLSFNAAGNTGSGPIFSADVNDDNSRWNGSSIAGKALSEFGNATLLTSNTTVTLNGQMVPLNVAREIVYVQSASSSVSGSDSSLSSSTLTPGVVTEGVSMSILPRVLDNNQVMMRYSLDLSTVEDIPTFSSPRGDVAIQTPRRSVRNFLQNVSIKSGNSLILTGFQQANASKSKSGPFSSNLFFLGGSDKSDSSNRTIIIVVTPYVVQQ